MAVQMPPLKRIEEVRLENHECGHCQGYGAFVDGVCLQCLKDGCTSCTDLLHHQNRWGRA